MPLDDERFLYVFAGRLMAVPWTRDAIRDVISNHEGPPALDPLKVSRRMMAAFRERPAYYDLVAWLRLQNLFSPLEQILAVRARRRRGKRRVRLLQPRVFLPPAPFAECGLPEISTEGGLAAWLGLVPPALEWLADVRCLNRGHAEGALLPYRYRWVPKRGGGTRLLEIPKRRLMGVQRQIMEELLNRLPLHEAVHGFRAGRSIVTNAAEHCGREAVLRFDLQDFFPSVTAARVFRIFLTLGYPKRVARMLAGLCTTMLPRAVWEARPGARLDGDFLTGQRLMTRHLPQGAPTSPALANLAAARLDRRLAGLARVSGVTYTRYADDLTFSGDASLARRRVSIEPLVGAIALEEGFALNHRKTRLMRAGVRQQVTGVVVNSRPNVLRDDFDRLKAILTNCRRHGAESQNREGVPDFRAHLLGRVSFIASVHRGRGEKLRQIYSQISWSN